MKMEKNKNTKKRKWKGKLKILTIFGRTRAAEPAEHTARTEQTFTVSYLGK